MGPFGSRTLRLAAIACHAAPFATVAAVRVGPAQGVPPLSGQASAPLNLAAEGPAVMQTSADRLQLPFEAILQVLERGNFVSSRDQGRILQSRFADTCGNRTLKDVAKNCDIVYDGNAESELVLSVVDKNYSRALPWYEQIYLAIGKMEGLQTSRIWIFCPSKKCFMPLRFGFNADSNTTVECQSEASWEQLERLQLVRIRSEAAETS